MSDDLVLVTTDGAVATITINRPEALNTLTRATLTALDRAIDKVAEDEAIRVVIVTGAGEKSFVAGADIAELNALENEQAVEEIARLGDRIFQRLHNLPKPVIAAINGYALGGGCELALACDIRIASDSARLGQPEVNYAIIAGWGGTQRLPRIVGPGMAKYLLFSGARIRADEALRIGLVDRVVPAGSLMDEANKLAKTIASKGPIALALTKELVNQALLKPLDEGLAAEAAALGRVFATEDRAEGTGAFLEKRNPVFKGR